VASAAARDEQPRNKLKSSGSRADDWRGALTAADG